MISSGNEINPKSILKIFSATFTGDGKWFWRLNTTLA
jgi:hypothetical protein